MKLILLSLIFGFSSTRLPLASQDGVLLQEAEVETCQAWHGTLFNRCVGQGKWRVVAKI
jgi:hypothetical protein